MKTLHRTLLAASLVAALGAGAIAQAQTPAQTAPGASASQPMRHGRMDPAKMEQFRARMQERMAKRLAKLKEKLQITSAQEPAWTAWTSALQPVKFQRPDRAAFRAMTTPERLDQIRALRAQRDAEMDKRMDATKSFYSALNAQQKKVFDEQGMRFLRGGKRGHRGHHGHHGQPRQQG
jgi:hypothetical protein